MLFGMGAGGGGGGGGAFLMMHVRQYCKLFILKEYLYHCMTPKLSTFVL